jgi:hypothetical protein
MATKSKIKKALPKRKALLKKQAAKKAVSAPTNGRKPTFVPTKLKLRRPVPSDIEIAQEAKVKSILQIASELGIRENELELFGPYKAKIKL